MTMQLSKAGAADLRLQEGTVLRFYYDTARVGTIGCGFTWRSAGFRKWWVANRPGQAFGPAATMTREECEACLIMIVAAEYGMSVNMFLSKDVPQNVFDGMVSPVYNCGAAALKWSWAAAAKIGNYHDAAERLKVTACTDEAGHRLAGLVRRRSDEARLIEFGIYASGGGGVTMPADQEVEDALKDGMLVRRERGNAVKELQESLIAHGYKPGNADGVFGYGTEAAVLDFQRDAKLTDDGKVGRVTGKALGLKWAA